ncbi:hypothetical protein MmiHf6_12470 [Methanimicrococcus hongohii]|uniref:Uncharacterized protein n=1 Tax=Methanimicrococcus hongohii TaxID=3028295 RepID=A0AA96V162_9EURY|nr:hypothetical protein [Methanimicrococcus sp. Hf6]WNY23923.1 hypothetical protein MmiHf6_12470 [Methanimicrococcus sp. Hf6]
MEFNQWISDVNEKYGLDDNDWEDVKNTTVLTFRMDDSGKVSSTYNGLRVYRHYDSEKIILPGETWICSLILNQTYTYFARGLQRIDSSFMFELKKDQKDAIAAGIWEKHKNTIEPLLEEKYKDILSKNIAQAVTDTRKEYETVVKELHEAVHILEQKDAENKNIITSLHEKLNASETEKKSNSNNGLIPNNGLTPNSGLIPNMPFYAPPQIAVSVRRDGPDSISSELFNKSRYFVHLSADQRIIAVKPHDEGNVVCMNNTIVLAGLSLLSSYSGPQEMVSEYNHIFGGIQIYL